MLSQLTTLVSVFDSSNWGIWSKAMKAYLQWQGLWGYVSGDIAQPANGHADHPAWDRANDMALGTLTLRLQPALQQNSMEATVEALWNNLRDNYGAPTVPSIYKDFKEAVSLHFNPNQHPAAQFDKLAAAFACLSAVSFGTGAANRNLTIQPQMQALIAMATLPSKWETLIPILTQSTDLVNLSLSDVRLAVIGQYETKINRGQHKGTHQANKISLVKCKHGGNPSFNQQGRQQQQQGSSSQPSNQQQHRQHGGRGQQGCGNKSKGLQ